MFRLIDDGIWDDPQIAKLPRDEKLIMVCLFTNIHTKCCGIYRITADRIGHMVDIPKVKVLKGLAALAKEGIAHYDGTEICIPGYIRRQRYKGPTMARRISQELLQVKNKDYIEMIMQRYPDFLKAGGFKTISPVSPFNDLHDDSIIENDLPHDDILPGKKISSVAGLAFEISKRLKYTGGVKPAILARLIKEDPEGEAGVRAAIARAEKYYATVKTEKWHSFIIARRFSKFCDFYGEAFSSDDALAEYLAKIRVANERDLRQQKREAHLHVGVTRPVVEEIIQKEKTPDEKKADEITDLKKSISRSNEFLKDPHKKITEKDRKLVLKNIENFEIKLKELEA